MVPFFKKGFDLSYTSSSLVAILFFLTYGLMSIPAGKNCCRLLDIKKGMVLGFVNCSWRAPCCFILHLYFMNMQFFSLLFFILAIGSCIIAGGANPYIAVLGSHRSASSRLASAAGSGFNRYHHCPCFRCPFLSYQGLKKPATPVMPFVILIYLLTLFIAYWLHSPCPFEKITCNSFNE